MTAVLILMIDTYSPTHYNKKAQWIKSEPKSVENLQELIVRASRVTEKLKCLLKNDFNFYSPTS